MSTSSICSESLDDNLVSKLVKEGEGGKRAEGIKSLE